MWLRRNRHGVSPVIAVILMVAITVVLAAVLYALVQNLIVPPGGNHPTVALGTAELQPDGTWKVPVVSVSSAAALGNYQASLLNGTAVAFSPTDVVNGTLGTKGGIAITFVDYIGPGTLNSGDFFTIAGLHSGSNYQFDLSWKPGGAGVIASKAISG